MMYFEKFSVGLPYGMGFGAIAWLVGYLIGKAVRFVKSVGR